MSAIISYPCLYHVEGSPSSSDTYNQVQFTPQGSFGSATIQNTHISTPPPVNDSVILYCANDRVNFGAEFMYVGNPVFQDSFTIYSLTSDDTSSINWFLIAETSSTTFPNKTVFLPWYDNANPTQICGKLTLDSNGQAILTSKYLTNSTEQFAKSRILLTLNTPFINGIYPTFDIDNYDPSTGSFTISAPQGNLAANIIINYFILTKNDHPYIPVSGSGTTIKLIGSGAGATYGFGSRSSFQPEVIATTAVEADSIIMVSVYTVSSNDGAQVLYVKSSDIVPGVSFTVSFTDQHNGSMNFSWLIIKPVGTP